MWMKRWHRWIAGRKRPSARRKPRGTFRPQLERLEQVIAPTLQLGPLALTPGGPIHEGDTATLSGSYVATNTIGRVSLVVNWGDGSTPSTLNLAPGNGSFSVPHLFVDNNPADNNTPTTIPVTVSAQLLDAGPSIIPATPNGTNKDGGGYQAIDYPFIRGISLATAPSSANVFNILTPSGTNNNQNNSVNLNGSTFTFYGQSFGNINVNENGLITFAGQPTIGGNPAGPNIGQLSDSPQQAAIAPFWTDLKLDPVTGRVLGRFVDTNGDGAADYLIIEFANARHVTAGGTTPQAATFQVFLQLNTGSSNGDVIFNYVNTAFGNASFDFGATNTTVGVKSANPTTNGTQPQKFTQVQFSSTDNFFGPGQAIRFSANTLGKGANPLAFSGATDGFGYNAFSLPGDVKFDLAPQSATNGVFDFTTVPFDATNVQVGNVAQVLGTNTFNLYGTTYSGASTIQITRNGYVSFGGTTNDTPNNPNTMNGTPLLAPALIAPLWDNLVGPTGTAARVSARLIDFDGNGTPEFLVLNWHSVHQGDINPDTPQNDETFQAVLELNTGGNPGGIFFDYVDTDVGNNAFNGGASATVGIKDVEPTTGNNRALTVLGPGGTPHAEIDTSTTGVKGIGIFQVGSSQSVNILVLNVPPVINQGGATDTINEGGKESRTVTITDPGLNDSFTGTIDWGDGSGVQNLNVAAVPNRAPTDPITTVLSHFYGEVGTFTVTITLRDKDNGIGTSSVTPPGAPITFTVIVKNIPPSHEPPNVPPIELRPGQILALPGPGAPALHFTDPAFAYDATRPQTETYTFSVNWGDGSPATTGALAMATTLVNGFAPAGTYVLGLPPSGPNGTPSLTQITLPDVNHTFATTGLHTVTVSVSDSNGATGTYQFVVENGAAHIYAVSGDKGTLPIVQFFSTRLNVPIDSILAYDASFRGGVRVAVGDVNGDGLADVITAPGPGGGPHIEVFDGATSLRIRSFFAYSPLFAGGVNVASADFNRDGFAEIVTGADAGGGPHVEMFSGKTGQVFQSFNAYDPNFRGGVRVATGDVTGDGIPDIVTAPGPGMAPLIRVWSGRNGLLVNQFFGFDPNFRGGAYVAVGDVNGDGRKDIIVTLGGGGGPFVRAFSGKTLGIISNITAFNPGSPTNGQLFTGGNSIWASGLRVAAAPLFTDNLADVIVASGPGRRPEVRIFRSATQQLLADFTFFDPSSLAGAFVAAG